MMLGGMESSDRFEQREENGSMGCTNELVCVGISQDANLAGRRTLGEWMGLDGRYFTKGDDGEDQLECSRS